MVVQLVIVELVWEVVMIVVVLEEMVGLVVMEYVFYGLLQRQLQIVNM